MTKVLIADDNKDFAELLENLFERSGYETHVAYDGFEAINHLKENPEYDLIITDIIMPGNDGLDLIKFAKTATKAKIIAISGGGTFISSKSTLQSIADQVDAALEKPIKMNDLLQCVKDVLKT